MNSKRLALIVGNSDGIGLGLTSRLLDSGWQVRGISRSGSPINDGSYEHTIADVTAADYPMAIADAAAGNPDLCVYCAGIGEELDLDAIERERRVFLVNLMGAVRTVEAVLPGMVDRRSGHIVVLSSLADGLVNPQAPSYSASKAGLSSYVEGLGLALRDQGVAITNVRFGFVDTKMAKGDRQPFKMTVDKAVNHIMRCIQKRPIRFSRPMTTAALVRLAQWMTRLKM